MKKRKSFLGRRLKKIRGWKKKHRRMVKISDITPEGFRLRTFNREYYVSREEFYWFKGASNRQIQDVILDPCEYDDPTKDTSGNHPGDHLRWEALDLDFCTDNFEDTEWLRYMYHSSRHVQEGNIVK